MKKIIWLFIGALLLMLSGCKKESNVLTAEQEAALMEKSIPGRQYMEGNRGLFTANDVIYWYDAATCRMNFLDENDMTWHILCGKPDCSHVVERVDLGNEHKSDCDAFIERMYYSPLGFYDGRIYYVEGVPTKSDRWLSSLKADGTDHRREYPIEFKQGAATQYYFHYGRLYVLNSYYEKNATMSIYVPGNKNPTVVTFDGEVTLLMPQGEYFYYPQYDFKTRSVMVKRMQLNGTISDFSLPESVSEQIAASIGVYFAEDAVYGFHPEKGLYTVDYATGSLTTLWDEMKNYDADSYYQYSDGNYLYLLGVGEDLFSQGDQKSLLVFDMEGNLIRDLEIVNTEEAQSDLREKLNSKTEEDLECHELYQFYHDHLIGDGGLNHAFYGSIKGYVFSGKYAMPYEYITVEELSNRETVPQWADTEFQY